MSKSSASLWTWTWRCFGLHGEIFDIIMASNLRHFLRELGATNSATLDNVFDTDLGDNLIDISPNNTKSPRGSLLSWFTVFSRQFAVLKPQKLSSNCLVSLGVKSSLFVSYHLAFSALKDLIPLTTFTTVKFWSPDDGLIYDWIKKSELQLHCFDYLENKSILIFGTFWKYATYRVQNYPRTLTFFSRQSDLVSLDLYLLGWKHWNGLLCHKN